jgi:voltage-gated potassium channel
VVYQHPHSIYWTIVTLTTVGYGDISPETPLGQFIASFVMGYGIAVPTGIVTAEIAKKYQNKIVTDKTMYWLRHRRLSRKR